MGVDPPGRNVTDYAACDERLLIEAVRGDASLYGHVVTRFERVLARYVKRVLGRHAEAAEDVLQEVFIKAYVNINDYDRARPFAPWLFRIAHNEAVSFLRKRKAEPQLVNGEDAGLILENMMAEGDPALHFEQGRTAAEVRGALKGLEPRYREVLMLRYLEDKSYDEIAEILQMPPGTVATLIRRGLRRLQQPLKATWGAV